MEFRPIKKKKTYEEIIEQVKRMIAEGVLQPGDRLISERELADKLEVGRSAVREAFRALEAMGVVEVRPGEGTFIREVDVGTIIETLGMVLVLERDTVKE
ncbi:MAG: GntR domain protein, partial [Clostridia bacterium 62_21]